jgi:signal transduction histidine kinase
MGMRERLRPFNGELVVESNNEGTKIVATLLAKAFLAKEQLVGGHELEVA